MSLSGVGSVVGGLLGGSSGSSQAGRAISELPNIGQNTSSWQSLMGNNISNSGYLQSMIPQIQSLFQSQYNNPYAAAMQTGAGTAGTALQGIGQQGISGANSIFGGGNQMLGQMQGILNAGYNPQSQLYNQQLQQATDQANVQASQAGLQGPYAASLTNNTTQNFNSNWLNQELARQSAATQAAGAAGQQGAGMLGQSLTQGGTGAGDIYAGAGMPYGAYQSIGQGQQNAFSNLFGNVGGVNSSNQQDMSQLMNYIQTALGQQQTRYNAMQQGAQSGAEGGSMMGGDIGGMLSGALGLAGLF